MMKMILCPLYDGDSIITVMVMMMMMMMMTMIHPHCFLEPMFFFKSSQVFHKLQTSLFRSVPQVASILDVDARHARS